MTHASRMAFPALAATAVLFLSSSLAHAGEFNYESFRFGDRALGMGGAVTAVPGQAESSYYNPAGFSLLDGTQISASLHFQGIDRRTLREGFFFDIEAGEFAPDSDMSDEEFDSVVASQNDDLVSDGFLPVPFASVFSLRMGRHAFGFSTFLSYESQESFASRLEFYGNELAFDSAEISDDATGSYAYSRIENDRVMMTGPSWAYEVSDRFHIGATAFITRREYRRSNNLSLSEDLDGDGEIDAEIQQSALVSMQDTSLVMRFGMLYRPLDWLMFGLNISTQSLSLANQGRLLDDYSFDFGDGVRTTDSNLYSNTDAGIVYPWSFTLGTAVHTRPAIVSVDVATYMPAEYDRLSGGGIDPELDGEFTGIPLQIEREMVTNLRVGAEIAPDSNTPVRIGGYTNFSASPLPDVVPFDGDPFAEDFDAEAEYQRPIQQRIDLFGATAGVGWDNGQQEFHLGVNVEWGQDGDDTVFENIRFPELGYFDAEREEFRVIFFFAGKIALLERIQNTVEGVQNAVDNLP